MIRRAFVVAMEDEADAVRPALRDGDRLFCCGIGKAYAAAATAEALATFAPDEIWNAGLAGGLDPAMALGDVYEVARAVQYDFDLSDVNGTGPGVLDGRDTPYFTCAPRGVFPAKTLATGDRFGNDEGDFALLRRLGCDLRDMEGAAIAAVCARRGVPCRLVKCVSDVAGRGGMADQYKVHRVAMLARLAEAVRRWA